MHVTVSLLAALASLSAIQPAMGLSTDFSKLRCIGQCYLDHGDPDFVRSQCTGDETGQDYIDCTCDSLSTGDFYDCMKGCPESEKSAYAETVEDVCPDLFGSGGGSSSSSSSSDNDSDNSSSSSSSDNDDDDDDDDSDNSTSNSTSNSSSDDDDEEKDEASDDDDDSGASLRNAPALAVAGGLIAALFM